MDQTDRIIFTSQVRHPEKGEAVLQIRVPVGQCWEHKAEFHDEDEDTPTPPHVHSTSAYHTDYEVCFGRIEP